MRLIAILLLSLLILGGAAHFRSPEYDEAYSIFLTSGDARPAWPDTVFHPAEFRSFYQGDPSPAKIAADLRQGDVHPPLYFWLLEYWRRLFGPGWFAARMLSVLFSLGCLACLGWVAGLAEIPVLTALLFTLFSYGFAYTGIIARGFALAQMLNIFGIALILSAGRSPNRAKFLGFTGGLAFGAAGFSNYLAVFIGLATLFWLALRGKQRGILALAAAGFILFLPAMLYFFAAQRHSRLGQFDKFSPPHAIALLAKDCGAAIFGGLPVYAGQAGFIVTIALIILTAICAGFVIKKWKPKLSLFALAAGSVPLGLLALGLAFNNTPIEIRYLAFAVPFFALLLAQTLPRALAMIVLAIQACGIAGLILAPSTMQPQGLAAGEIARLNMRQALVLLPFGNDGVGIPGPFIVDAPAKLRLQLIRPGQQPDLSDENTVILVPIRADAASKTASSMLTAFLNADPCWRRQPALHFVSVYTRACEKH